LIPGLKQARNVPIIWRCHVGVDVPSELTRRAWRFLTPYVEQADAIVFSRRAQVWETLDPAKIDVIAPVIDVFSTKNQDLDDATVDAILSVAGFCQHTTDAATFTRVGGAEATVKRPADIIESQPLRGDERFVLQVSRWDKLKDPVGVITGFVEYIAPETDAHLVYAGPEVSAVADDPEGQAVLDEVRKLFDRLPADAQERLHLACLPMTDLEENAAIVNALQRRAAVVVQKSLAEGFGLTVAEALWKARPVVASRVGGIQDQIVDGVGGLLLEDPRDLRAFGAAVVGLLRDPERAHSFGLRGQARVRDEFLSARSLMQYLDLIERLLD
jgi:trehalose synthase